MDAILHHYLCSFCGKVFQAPAGSFSRLAADVRCPLCTPDDPYDDAGVAVRLSWITM